MKIVNSRGQPFWLHKKGRLYLFSKNSKNSISLPKGYHIIESKKTGLPILKKD